jgi:hypothetical protein
MSVIDTLTQRDEAFASSRFSADLKIMPSTARACFRVSPGRFFLSF